MRVPLEYVFFAIIGLSACVSLKVHFSLAKDRYNDNALEESHIVDIHPKIVTCSDETDIKCIKRLWKGDAISDLPNNIKLEVSVVIAYCGEDMSLFTDYIDDRPANVRIRTTTIITCPSAQSLQSQSLQSQSLQSSHNHNIPDIMIQHKSHWEHPGLVHMQWLADTLTTASIPRHYQQNNHFILFLNAESFQKDDPPRKLEEVLQGSLENGAFGCLQIPAPYANYPKSYYHDYKFLRRFANLAKEPKPKYYKHLGEWQDQLNFTSIIGKDLVPVCYGNSFAILSRDAVRKSKLYKPVMQTMQIDSKRGEDLNIITAFLERSWASIFSYHMPKQNVKLLRNFATGMFNRKCCTNGALLRKISESPFANHYLFKFFTGDTVTKEEIDYSKLNLTLVVSHCDEDMSWMQEYMKDLRIQNVTIYSKCNSTVEGYSPPGSIIVRLPNFGRCDHSYAHWMTQMDEKDATNNHIVLFIKASRLLIQGGMSYRPIHDVIRIAIQHGFSCESKPTDKSLYYNSSLLRKFTLEKHKKEKIRSKYTYMGEWLDELDLQLPTLTPVCYGGNFAVKASQIYSRRNTWERIEPTLMRGDNIEEGHFAERAWAGLLSYPLTSNETNVLQSLPYKVVQTQEGGYIGHLILDEDLF